MKFSGLLIVITVGTKKTEMFILEAWVTEQLEFK